MKDILLSFPGFENNVVFKIDDVNGFNNIWRVLRKRLHNLGYNLKTADQNKLSNCAWVLFVNGADLGEDGKNNILNFRYVIKNILGKLTKKRSEKGIYDECIYSGLRDKMALFLWEGPSVYPNNYKKELYDKFSTIFTWKDDLVDGKKFFKFYLPYPVKRRKINKINFSEKKFLVNISMNKFSNLPNELYSMRKKSVKFFENKLGDQFDLFGYGWDQVFYRGGGMFPFLLDRYRSYRGVSQDKLETLSHYKFALCYENTQHLKGYITEKIFDCFNARTVPIYWGAENVEDYIIKEAFIDRRQFGTDQELLDFLNKIDEEEYNRYLLSIENFLDGEKYKLFLPTNFVNIVVNRLRLKDNSENI